MTYTYIPKGVCSMKMVFEIEGDIVKSLQVIGGCPGNTIGVSKLVEGKNIVNLSTNISSRVSRELKDNTFVINLTMI